jgi:hypothetical protein
MSHDTPVSWFSTARTLSTLSTTGTRKGVCACGTCSIGPCRSRMASRTRSSNFGPDGWSRGTTAGAMFVVVIRRRCHRRLRVRNGPSRRAITMGLTAGRGARNLNSSRVAIGRHSSAVASSHAERLRTARPQGNGPKHPTGAGVNARIRRKPVRDGLRPLEATAHNPSACSLRFGTSRTRRSGSTEAPVSPLHGLCADFVITTGRTQGHRPEAPIRRAQRDGSAASRSDGLSGRWHQASPTLRPSSPPHG